MNKKILDAHDGKSLFIDWNGPIDTVVDSAFTLPNGERTVHVSSKGVIPEGLKYMQVDGWYSVWYFGRRGGIFDKVCQVS